MPSSFQFLGDQREAQGHFPVYSATNDEVWFDEGLFPHTRNEEFSLAANTWSGWKSLTGPYVKGGEAGSGQNSNGSQGFFLQYGYRFLTAPDVSRDAEIEIAADNDVDTILYHIHMPFCYQADQRMYYPLVLPPGLLKVRYRVQVQTPVSLKLFLSNGSIDMLSGYSSFEKVGYVEESGGGVIIDGSDTIYQWGPWTFVGQTTKTCSMLRPMRRANGSDGNTANCYFQVGVGEATNPRTIWENHEMSAGNEQASRSNQLVPCNLLPRTNIYIRVFAPGTAISWQTDGYWHVECFG